VRISHIFPHILAFLGALNIPCSCFPISGFADNQYLLLSDLADEDADDLLLQF